MTELVRYRFPEGSNRDLIQNDIILAIFASECIHGRPRTRLDVTYFLSSSGRRCVLAINGAAGDSAARIFTGLCSARFGESGYRIARVRGEGPR